MKCKFVKFKNLKLRISKEKKLVTEEDVRLAINFDLEKCLEEDFGKTIFFKAEKKLIENSRRVDSAYSNFLIEYKKPIVELEEEQEQQLIDYMESFALVSDKTQVWGILTNGIDIKLYEYNKKNKEFKRNESFSGKLTIDKLYEVCQKLAKNNRIILNEGNIGDYCGLEVNNKVPAIIRMLFNKLLKTKNKRTKLLYSEWERLSRLSSDKDKWNEDKGKNRVVNNFYEKLLNIKIKDNKLQYSALFSIQTYYAIIVKLILYKFLKNKFKEPLNDCDLLSELFKNIESNDFYVKHNILNLIDGDFYSWYIDELSESDYENIYEIIENVYSIETINLNQTLISFYETIFPFHVRHSMGEYYTKKELAAKVLDEAIKLNGGKFNSILDPTCGSGVFLATAKHYGIAKEIYGIDINPLAVLTAKASLLLNNYSLKTPTEIPVYLGDSTYSPEEETIEGVECYIYDYITCIKDINIKVVLPKSFINEKKFFEILGDLEIQIRLKNKKTALNLISSYISSRYDMLKSYYDKLIDDLISLEEKQLNSIWLKIIGNYFKAASVKDIDLIVGNPPWVRWSNLPTNYKSMIKKTCKIDGLFSDDKNSGGVDLNIAPLIAHVCIRDRLNKNGILAFLMPDTILTNKSFQGFRKMDIGNGNQFYLNKVVRWNGKEKPFLPVTLPFAEYYFSFKKSKIECVDKKQNKTYEIIQCSQSFNNHFVKGTNNTNNTFLGKNKLDFHLGVNMLKGGYYQLKFKSNIDDKLAEFYTYEVVNDRLKLSNKVITIEKEIVYPYIRTTNIVNKKEIKKCDMYCIFPVPYGSKKSYPLRDVKNKFPNFYRYLNSFEVQNSINTSSDYNKRIQKNNDDLGVFRFGKYTFGDYFLITRNNTHAHFSKIAAIKTDWGETKMPIFENHVIYLSTNEKGKPLTKTELDHLFKVFCKKEVQEYIENSSDSRSISSRLCNDIKI